MILAGLRLGYCFAHSLTLSLGHNDMASDSVATVAAPLTCDHIAVGWQSIVVPNMVGCGPEHDATFSHSENTGGSLLRFIASD